jgi:hypothetical protein
MSYDYMFFRPPHRLASHDEIDEDTIIPFGSNENILTLLRKLYPSVSVDAEGFGWLNPAEYIGEIYFPDDELRVFYISRIERDEVEKLCQVLGLAAFDGQAMELIQPE